MQHIRNFGIVGILSVLLASCMTAFKAQSFLERKGKLAAVCAAEYPVRDSVIVRPGTWTVDTLLAKVPDSIGTITDTPAINYSMKIPITLPFPVPDLKVKYQTLTIYRTKVDTILEIRADQAHQSALQAQISAQTAQIGKITTQRDSAQNGRNIWRWIALALMLPWVWKGGAGVYTLISQAEKRVP